MHIKEISRSRAITCWMYMRISTISAQFEFSEQIGQTLQKKSRFAYHFSWLYFSIYWSFWHVASTRDSDPSLCMQLQYNTLQWGHNQKPNLHSHILYVRILYFLWLFSFYSHSIMLSSYFCSTSLKYLPLILQHNYSHLCKTILLLYKIAYLYRNSHLLEIKPQMQCTLEAL